MLAALGVIAYILALICGIASLVFFVMVLIQMFKRDESTMGIICIVLTFCTGIGPIIAFIYGWTKAAEWGIKDTMKYWTIVFIAQIVLFGLAIALWLATAATMDPDSFNIDPDSMNFEIDMDGAQFDMEGMQDAFDNAEFNEAAVEVAPE